jgi:hypothetical protein
MRIITESKEEAVRRQAAEAIIHRLFHFDEYRRLFVSRSPADITDRAGFKGRVCLTDVLIKELVDEVVKGGR